MKHAVYYWKSVHYTSEYYADFAHEVKPKYSEVQETGLILETVDEAVKAAQFLNSINNSQQVDNPEFLWRMHQITKQQK